MKTEAPPHNPLRRSRRSSLLLGAVGAAVLLVLLLLEPMQLSSGSMSPTLHQGQQLLVLKHLGFVVHPSRGDLVVFHPPGTSGIAVKRVAAVGGEEVGIEDGLLVVQKDVVEEPYVDFARVDSTYWGPITVPDGHLFVLGDNRADSIDSRDYGPVSLDQVVGIVLLRGP